MAWRVRPRSDNGLVEATDATDATGVLGNDATGVLGRPVILGKTDPTERFGSPVAVGNEVDPGRMPVTTGTGFTCAIGTARA